MKKNPTSSRETAAYHLGHARASMWFDSVLVSINLGMMLFFPPFALLHGMCALLFGTKCVINYLEMKKLQSKYGIDEKDLKSTL